MRLHHNRQLFDRAQSGAPVPADSRWVDRKLELRPAHEQRLQRASRLYPRQLMAEAKMDSGAEGDMPVRPPLEIEPFRLRVRLRVQIGRDNHGHDLVALAQANALKLDIVAHVARF